MHVTHLAFDFGLGHQGGHGVDDDHVNRVGAHQHVGDFQRLLAGVRLRDQQVVDIDAQLASVLGIESMLGVDEGASSAVLLGFGNDRQGQRGFTRRLRTVDLDDTAFWQTTNTKGDVQPQGAGGNGRHALALMVAHAHDCALAELAFDLTQGRSQGAFLVVVH
ncbi:hypothetical protein D3C81_716980 [compost metagenome]